MKSFKLETKREDVISTIVTIIFILIIVFVYSYFTTDNNEIVLTSSTGEVVLVESKYFWGGVWFDNDRLNILYDKFDIENNSLISGKETVQLPLSKIKKVTFEEGFEIYEIKIVSEGGFFNKTNNFYLRNRNNFQIVKNKIIEIGGGNLVFEETRTFLNRLFKKKKPLSEY